ncbi:hypothetical protein SAMN05216185_1223 [Pseudomonas guariconensis]|uniref:hypothetical protein n=1 Tax=Pseudomonas guariconensis TaxID=1288410 RepID=UPI00088A73E0|nr:hypothetical protein [Pseudomonas guariconensis]SDE24443.1 hypothetical protein SAMN05216185_1223 [Pseudomonas guariconensis]
MKFLALHWPSNSIHTGYENVTADEQLVIKHRYKGSQWHLVQVCDVIFEKYHKLHVEHDSVSVNQLVRVSKAFLSAVKQLKPAVRRSHWEQARSRHMWL